MAGHGGGYTVPVALVNKLDKEGRRSFQSREHGIMTLKTCNRCGGSGSYSYCQMYGTKCFGCAGAGMVAVPGTEEDLAKKEAKNARARERAAERKREKAAAAQANEERILGLLGLTITPTRRGRPSIITSRFDDECQFCRETTPTGSEIVLGDFRGVYHVDCFADRLLQDIEDARPLPEYAELPF